MLPSASDPSCDPSRDPPNITDHRWIKNYDEPSESQAIDTVEELMETANCKGTLDDSYHARTSKESAFEDT